MVVAQDHRTGPTVQSFSEYELRVCNRSVHAALAHSAAFQEPIAAIQEKQPKLLVRRSATTGCSTEGGSTSSDEWSIRQGLVPPPLAKFQRGDDAHGLGFTHTIYSHEFRMSHSSQFVQVVAGLVQK